MSARRAICRSRLEGAPQLPLDQLAQGISRLAPDRHPRLVLYCASGARSAPRLLCRIARRSWLHPARPPRCVGARVQSAMAVRLMSAHDSGPNGRRRRNTAPVAVRSGARRLMPCAVDPAAGCAAFEAAAGKFARERTSMNKAAGRRIGRRGASFAWVAGRALGWGRREDLSTSRVFTICASFVHIKRLGLYRNRRISGFFRWRPGRAAPELSRCCPPASGSDRP